ncbi:hypothetical protein [Methylobacterium sp. J-059]|nr:hypothetical protein [Methylobacterium sp. J-059]
MAGRTWLKPHYVATDYDPVTKELLPGSMAPGMYVEDEQTFD